MDFFERQERARRRTKWLSVYFILAVIVMIATIYVALLLIFFREQRILWHPELFLGVSVGTLAIIFFGSLYKILELRGNGGTVARTLGGRPLAAGSTDLDEQRLLNVVEEMAIASGTAVPELYVLDDENGINAFAAGHTPSDAAIGVTRGSLQVLTRDELQGVIAHEFSHILNGDMRLNLRLIGLVHGILCLAIIGRILLRTGSRRRYALGARNKGGNPLPIIGLVLIVFGSVGVFFGRMIKAAVSRQREFLADAAAVQFTRNPEGLSGALKKIGGAAAGSRLQTPHAEEASHLFFGNGMGAAWLNLMSTHPPLIERIKALDPQFDGTFLPVDMQPPASSTPPARRAVGTEGTEVTQGVRTTGGHSSELSSALAGSARVSGQSSRGGAALLHAGRPTAAHLAYAVAWKESLPPGILDAAHHSDGACALVYGLLLSSEPAMREQQLELLQTRLEPQVLAQLQRFLPVMSTLDRSAQLPLVDVALTGLRALTPPQFEQFVSTLKLIIEHDREVNLFEYALQKVVVRHLEPHFKPPRRSTPQYHSIRPLLPDCAVVLSALAHSGHGESDQAARAFAEGVGHLRVEGATLQLLAPDAAGLAQIDSALERLALASPPIKKTVLDACAHTVASDGVIESGEAEMLRAVADTLDCPLPPLLGAPNPPSGA